jgi:hypothetical protein
MIDTMEPHDRESAGVWLLEIHVSVAPEARSAKLGRAILGRRDLPPIGTWGRENWAACRIPTRRFVWGFESATGRYVVLVREPRTPDVPIY